MGRGANTRRAVATRRTELGGVLVSLGSVSTKFGSASHSSRAALYRSRVLGERGLFRLHSDIETGERERERQSSVWLVPRSSMA